MKISIRKNEIKLVDENMYPTSELYVEYYPDDEMVHMCVYQPEHGDQHDFVLLISEWNVVKNFIENKIKETESLDGLDLNSAVVTCIYTDYLGNLILELEDK